MNAIHVDFSTTACPCCGRTGGRPRLAKEGWRYMGCAECGTSFLSPPPASPTALYDEGYFRAGEHGGYADYEADEPLHRANAVQRLAALARAGVHPPDHLLDVGCATGFLLDEARSFGWSAEGVEPSAWARARAIDRTGLPVHATLDEVQGGAFGAVTLFQVLEHMLEPEHALRAARRALRPGGVLAIETWDQGSAVARLSGAHWQQVTPPSVIHLFTRAGLDRLLTRTGFGEVTFSRTRKAVSVRFVATLLAKKYPRLGRPLAAVAESRLGRLHASYGLGDLVMVTARAAS